MSEIHENIVKEIVDQLKNQLTGSDQGDLLFKARPQRHYPIGNLSPEKQSGDDTIYPSSCGFIINLSGDEKSSVEIKIQGHYYIRRKATLKEQLHHLANQWQLDINEVKEKLKENPKISLPYCWSYIPFHKSTKINIDLNKTEIDLTNCLIKSWKEKNIQQMPVKSKDKSNYNLTESVGRYWSDEQDYQEWLTESFEGESLNPETSNTHKLVLTVEWKNDKLKINAINRSQRPEEGGKEWFLVDQNIYNVNFEIKLDKDLKLIERKKEIKDSFNATSSINSWGEGKNLQLKKEKNGKIIAEPFGIIRSDRVKPKNKLGKADLSFSTLARDPITSSEVILNYLQEYEMQYNKINSNINSIQSNDAHKQIKRIVKNIEKGIDLLKNNASVRDAFKLMNETFYRRYITEENITSWRGFQYVYMLGKLPEIINPNEEKVDVIFVPTGGGKTETYFGFLITVLFYLRLNSINIGTVAIVKFPLRMLALDQIQRIAPLIAIADMVRKENPKIKSSKDDPSWLNEFSLGFMIGGTSSRTTPNRVHGYKQKKSSYSYNDEVEIIDENTDLYQILTENPEELQVLFKCPVCIYKDFISNKKVKDSYETIKIKYDEKQIRAEHRCEKCGTRFPIHWTDEECFRYHPSIIISTQDRVAYSAFTPFIRGILGGPIFYCPDHGFSVYSDRCSPFKGGYGKLERECSFLKKNKNLDCVKIKAKDRALRYVIQDEMHLLKSDLGALNSPFEKMISDTVRNYSDRGVQYIGMSATVQGVSKQVIEIYGKNKKAWLFPGDPPCADFSKKIDKDAFFEYSNDMHRLFVGCTPSSVDPSTVVSKIINSTTELVNTWKTLIEKNQVKMLPNSFNKYSSDELNKAINFYIVNLGFMRTKIDLERTKQNLINIYNVERKKQRKIQGNNIPELIVEELTGDNSIKDIREVISKIKQVIFNYENEKLDVLLATNLVSHGIDLKEMNLMTFYGIPGSTAEYIQAMSRVGRTFPGLIFIVYHPNRARDRGLWRTFVPYHIALRQQVETMPVDHLAPGLLDQTLVTLLRCYWNLIHEVKIFNDHQGLYSLKQIISYVDNNGFDNLVEPAKDTLLKWLEWDESHEITMMNNLVEYLETLKRYHNTIKNKGYPHNIKVYGPAPFSYNDLYLHVRNQAKEWMSTMTGIRGIQPGISNVSDKFSSIYLESGDI